MKILVVSGDPKHIPEYLQKTGGHEIKECYSTDHAARMAYDYKPDAVLFFSDAVEMRNITHEDALKAIVPKTRVILLAKKTDSLVVYASGLGVRDFVFFPVNPADILHRLENPAMPEDAAEMLTGVTIPQDEVDLCPEKRQKMGIGGILSEIRGAISKRQDAPEIDDSADEENWNLPEVWDNTPDTTEAELLEEKVEEKAEETAENEEELTLTWEDGSGEPQDAPGDDEGKSLPRSEPESIPEPAPVRAPQQNRGLFQVRKIEPEKQDICYMPHQLVAVWSPEGWAKSYTAFNLAAVAAMNGFDAALVNYDMLCPELDKWFGIKQTGMGDFTESSAGVMTFGEDSKAELISRFLKKRTWGIQYLPAGNKLGNIATPNIPEETMERVLWNIYNRNAKGKPAITVVDAGRDFELANTMTALRQAAIVLIPTNGSPTSGEVAQDQIEELIRVGCSPRFIEVLFTTPGRKAFHICPERCSIPFDWNTFLIDQENRRPQCQKVDGRRAWEGVLNYLAPSSSRRW